MSDLLRTKFFSVFSTLSEEKRMAFIDFAQNNYFNSSTKVNDFLNIVANSKKIPNKNEIYTLLYSNKTYNDVDLRMIINKAYTLTLQFLAVDETLQNSLSTYKALLTNTNIDKNDLLKKIRSELENHQESSTFFKHKHQYENAYFENEYKTQLETKRQISLDFEMVEASLNNYFVLEKLKLLLTKVNYFAMVQNKNAISLIDELRLLVPKVSELPILAQLYYHCILLYLEPSNEDNFVIVNTLIDENEFKTSTEELREIFKHVQNFCIRMVNQGEKQFLAYLFNNYLKMFELKTVLENGTLSQWTLKNTVAAGVRLKEFEKTQILIETYKIYLPSNIRESAYNFNMASIYFETKNYTNSLNCLQKVFFKDIFYQLGAKVMLAKTYFELDDDDGLLYTIDNIKKLLTRKKELTQRHIDTHKNFAKLIVKIRYAKKIDKDKLEKQISATNLLAERNWLLEKLK